MKKFFYIVLLNSLLFKVYGQNIKCDTMAEKFNYEAFGGAREVSLRQGEWIIDIFAGPPGCQYEYAPAKDFYMIQKLYHNNGMIASRGKRLGNVPFGIWAYFDENGRLIKEVDEDAKFGKIKPKDVIHIMEEVGWINRKTGENIITGTPLAIDGSFYKKICNYLNGSRLDVYFGPARFSESGEEIQPTTWEFGYWKNPIYTYYRIDGNTGKYERFETMRFRYV